jgi:hypothetical protein
LWLGVATAEEGGRGRSHESTQSRGPQSQRTDRQATPTVVRFGELLLDDQDRSDRDQDADGPQQKDRDKREPGACARRDRVEAFPQLARDASDGLSQRFVRAVRNRVGLGQRSVDRGRDHVERSRDHERGVPGERSHRDDTDNPTK